MIPMNVYPASSVVPIFFSTYGKTNGESITLTGLAVTDIEIYKGTSTTQRASDAGYTLLDTDGIDIDGITGIHGFSIDLGDNTDAGFYSVGSFYTVVVSAVTVDSQTVNFIADRFRIVPAEGITGYPKVDVHAFAGTAATVAAGIPEVKVASIANNAVTAAAIATGAIDADSIAADAITAAKVADGTIDAATFAAGAINAAAIADGAIDAATFAAGAIDAAAIAANAIGASELAADAVAEIADAVWDEATAGHATAGSTAVALTDILTDTAEIGAAGAGLTNINLPNQTMDIVGNITGNLSGSVGSVTGAVGSVTGAVGSVTGAVGSVTGAVGSVTGNVGGNVTGSVGSLATQAKADVNAEVLDVMNTDTFAEPGQEAPGATVSLVKKIGYLYKAWRNKKTQTATTMSLYADDATTVDQKATTSEDGTTGTVGEITTGP